MARSAVRDKSRPRLANQREVERRGTGLDECVGSTCPLVMTPALLQESAGLGGVSALVGARGRRMNDFKGHHFGGEFVLWAVRWYCRYAISYGNSFNG